MGPYGQQAETKSMVSSENHRHRWSELFCGLDDNHQLLHFQFVCNCCLLHSLSRTQQDTNGECLGIVGLGLSIGWVPFCQWTNRVKEC